MKQEKKYLIDNIKKIKKTIKEGRYEEAYDILLELPPDLFGKPSSSIEEENVTFKHDLRDIFASIYEIPTVVAIDQLNGKLAKSKEVVSDKPYANSNPFCATGPQPIATFNFLKVAGAWINGPITGRPQAYPFCHFAFTNAGWGFLHFGEDDQDEASKKRWSLDSTYKE